MNVGAVALQPSLQALQQIQNLNQPEQITASGHLLVPQEGTNVFSAMLDAYMSMVSAAGTYEANAQNITMDFVTGRHDDMLAVILAQEQAYASMFFTVQVTSRIISSYQEIMRLQI